MDSQPTDELLLPDEMVEQLARAQDSVELQQQFIIQQQPDGQQQQQIIIQQPEGQQQLVIQPPGDQQQKIIIKQVQQQPQQQQQPVIKHLQLEQLLQPGQQQPGMNASPKLQQIITAAVQKPQILSVTPKLQQVVVASGQQGNTTASKLQQIISAAVQPSNTAGTQQIHRIVTNAPQGVIGTSQLQQMISGGTQAQQGTHRIQHIVVSSSQLQQIVNSSAQFQQNVPGTQQQQKVITSTSSSPLLQSVIASTQSQGGKPSGQVLLQGVRMASPTVKAGQQIVRPGTSQAQQQAIVPSSQPQQVIRQATSTVAIQPNSKTVTSQPQTISKPGSSQQVQYVTKTTGSNVVQTVKTASTAQLQQNQRQPIHVIKPSTSSQSQQPKTPSLTPLQQASKTPVFPQASQVFRTTTAHTLQTVSTTQSIAPKPQTVTQVKREGVVATPRLQPATSATPSKKEKKESSAPKEPKVPPKPSNLGDIVGRLTQGSRHVKRFKEDRRNIVKPVKALSYGCYGSYAPAYDSTFSNLSKEQSDLLNGSFDDFEPSPQIKQILSKDYDYTTNFADNLIDILSGGKESKKLKLEKEEPMDEMDDSSSSFETRRASLNEDDEMATLSSLGIDLSHLSNLHDPNSAGDEGSPVVQQTLEQTTSLLKKLQELQYERLSVPPHPRLGHTILPPSDTEMKLATEITDNLANLAKQVPPGALVGDHISSF